MKKLFYLVVVLQLLFLVGEVGMSQLTLSQGQVVTLKCAPVDPRSVFMGNYMILSYDISTIDLGRYAEPTTRESEFKTGRTVYVGLMPGKPYAAIHRVNVHMPTKSSIPYLKGRITSRHGSIIRVEYGLERYYIPEARQREAARIEWGQGQLSVRVAIGDDGKGIIKKVLVSGRTLGF